VRLVVRGLKVAAPLSQLPGSSTLGHVLPNSGIIKGKHAPTASRLVLTLGWLLADVRIPPNTHNHWLHSLCHQPVYLLHWESSPSWASKQQFLSILWQIWSRLLSCACPCLGFSSSTSRDTCSTSLLRARLVYSWCFSAPVPVGVLCSSNALCYWCPPFTVLLIPLLHSTLDTQTAGAPAYQRATMSCP
jgi:hypothetical protein